MNSVAIVGAHQDTRHLAPYDDPTVDIWVQNESGMMPWCPKVDAVFQVHLPTVYKNPQNRAEVPYWEWLQQEHRFPIYMQKVDPEVPSSVRYPFEEVQSLPLCEPKMFTSTTAYMLAYAVLIGVPKIQMYGIEASFYQEYKQQREGIAYWVGYCQGHGIPVERHCGDGLFVQPLYGRENIWRQDPKTYYTRITDLNHRIKDASRRVETASPTSENWLLAFRDLNVAKGQRAERQRYLDKVNDMLKQTGDAILDKSELERAAKDYLPKIDDLRMRAQAALGRQDIPVYRKLLEEAYQHAGRWQENQDMLKGV